MPGKWCKCCLVQRPFRESLVEVVALEVDAVQQVPTGRGLAAPLQRGGRDVDGDDPPAVFGEPQRVGALTAAQVQGPSRRQFGGHLGQPGVDPPAPRPLAGAIALFPKLLGILGLVRAVHAAILPNPSGVAKLGGRQTSSLDHCPARTFGVSMTG